MEAVVCGRDGRQMTLLCQFQVQGVDTFRYHCFGCGGRADIQMQGNQARQVQLSGHVSEWKPQSIRPHDQIEIPVAYTLGHSRTGIKRVPTQPMAPPQAAYRLAPGQENRALPPGHPMHPDELRRRIMGNPTTENF